VIIVVADRANVFAIADRPAAVFTFGVPIIVELAYIICVFAVD